MLDVAVYSYIAGYHLLDLRGTQYGHKVTRHFLMIPTVVKPENRQKLASRWKPRQWVFLHFSVDARIFEKLFTHPSPTFGRPGNETN